MPSDTHLWLWHVPYQRWQFRLIAMLVLGMRGLTGLFNKCIVMTSRMEAWHSYLQGSLTSSEELQDLLGRLFFFEWGGNQRNFLEACDDLSLYLASIPSHRVTRNEDVKEKPRAHSFQVLLVVDELPSLAHVKLKKRQWIQQVQSGFYRQELIHQHALCLFKEMRTLSGVTVLLLTRQFPQVEKFLWHVIQKRTRSHLMDPLPFSQDLGIPRWMTEMERWLLVMTGHSTTVDPRRVIISIVKPRGTSRAQPSSPFDPEILEFHSLPYRLDEDDRLLARIIQLWLEKGLNLEATKDV